MADPVSANDFITDLADGTYREELRPLLNNQKYRMSTLGDLLHVLMAAMKIKYTDELFMGEGEEDDESEE